MSAWESPIIRVSTGLLNTVDDTVIANQAGVTGISKFGGQLGKVLWVGSEQIKQMFDPSVGTLYAGAYQYVQLAADTSTPEIVIGQMLFWDDDPNDPATFTVTDTNDETNVPAPAGVFIGGMDPGNYGFIQIAGLASLLYGTLSAGGATGQGVVVTTHGLADNATPVNPIYVGWAYDLPVAHALKLVQLSAYLSRRG